MLRFGSYYKKWIPHMNDEWTKSIAAEASSMEQRLMEWASINSGSSHESGLLCMLEALQRDFAELPVQTERVRCPGAVGADGGPDFPRYALRVKPRRQTPPQRPIFLNGHYDTVYGPGHPFQKVERLSENRLRGPGVTDMKGGLVVLLTALKIWEGCELAGKLSWEVLITPDEEIGSPASDPLLREAAERCRFGIVYESAFVDGGFVRSRKGSAVYEIQANGQSAHVGRNYEEGRNAILGLAQMTQAVQEIADELNLTANVGRFHADSPLNVVPDKASCLWNVRAAMPEDFVRFEAALDRLIREKLPGFTEGITFRWSGGLVRPPKTLSEANQRLYDAVETVARSRGLPTLWRDTGGGADGSNLAAYGLPNIDNLGVRGGAIHSDQEFIELDSLSERVGLTLAILGAVARGEFGKGEL